MNRPWLIVVPIAVVLLTSDLVSGFTSLHSGGPEYFAVLTALGGAGFVLAGLLAWRRPLGQAIGQVLVLVGLLWLLFGALWAANDPLLYTVGEGFGSIPIASLLYLVLVYPVGRPTTPLERILAYVLFPTALLANFLPVLFQGRFGNDCPGCSRNRFLISDQPTLHNGLTFLFTAVGVVFFLGVVVLTVRRWRAATPAMRRVLNPVYFTGGVAVAMIGVGFVAGSASHLLADVLWGIAFVGVVALPFAFIAGLVRSRLMLGLRQLLDYADVPTTAEAQVAVRRALGDPTARLGYWLESASAYVCVDGDSFPGWAPRLGRMTTTIDASSGSRLGRVLAVLAYLRQ